MFMLLTESYFDVELILLTDVLSTSLDGHSFIICVYTCCCVSTQ